MDVTPYVIGSFIALAIVVPITVWSMSVNVRENASARAAVIKDDTCPQCGSLGYHNPYPHLDYCNKCGHNRPMPWSMGAVLNSNVKRSTVGNTPVLSVATRVMIQHIFARSVATAKLPAHSSA